MKLFNRFNTLFLKFITLFQTTFTTLLSKNSSSKKISALSFNALPFKNHLANIKTLTSNLPSYFSQLKEFVKVSSRILQIYFIKIARNTKVRKTVKYTGLFFILLFFVLFLLTKLIDANKYRSQIEQLAFEKTGKTLILQGPLSIQSFPRIAIVAEDIILKEKPESKKEIAHIKRLKIAPSLFALLTGRFNKFGFDLADIQLNNRKIQNLCTNFIYKQNSMEFNSIKLVLLHGKEQGVLHIDQVIVDLEKEIPKYYVKHDGTAFPLSFLLTMSGSKNKVTGDTRLKVDLSAEGINAKSIKKSLTGQIEMEISKGKIYGVDLITSLKDAKSIMTTVASGISKTFSAALNVFKSKKRFHPMESTPFDVLKVTAELNKGILTNQDLVVNHKHYHLQGSGKINLVQEDIDFCVRALYKEKIKSKNKKDKKHHNANPLIVYISGNFDNLNIKPDFDSYFKYIN